MILLWRSMILIFSIHQLLFDSASFANPINLLKSDWTKIKTGHSKFRIRDKNIIAAFNGFYYSSQSGDLEINKVHLMYDTTDIPGKAEMLIDLFALSDFRPEKYSSGHPLSMSISITNPRFNVDLDNSLFQLGEKRKEIQY